MNFEPTIVTFMCNWCGYAAADLAGTSRLQYPPTVRIIRTLCTGRFEPEFVLRAFEKGADGVLICGCHPGDCQNIDGNIKAEKKIDRTKRMLKALGIDPERCRLEWVSAAEGARFAELVKEFTKTLQEKGPSPLNRRSDSG
ncbi:MAG: hydrogenase iron-sulfur subunit [Candidatus Hydrothermarchaeales archaeon]